MKKLICRFGLIELILTFVLLANVFAQVPKAFKYQLVARGNTGTVLANKSIALQVSILQGSETGAAVYVERQTGTTTQFGLLSILIGKGTLVSGDFTTIDWSNNTYFLKLEIDASGGTTYSTLGTSQLLAVPYALYAEKAGGSVTMDEIGVGPGGHISLSDYNNQFSQVLPIASGDAKINDVVVSNGYIYLTGDYINPAKIVSTSLDTSGDADVYVAKVSLTDGSLAWVKSAKASASPADPFYKGTLSSKSIAVDGTGNVYIQGVFQYVANFSGTVLDGGNNSQRFLAEYDGNGNLGWAKMTIPLDKTYKLIGHPTDAKFLLLGSNMGALTFDGLTLASPGSGYYRTQHFLAEYSSSGVISKLTRLFYTGDDYYSIIENRSASVIGSNLYIGAKFTDSIYIGGTGLYSTSNLNNYFSAKYSLAGVFSSKIIVTANSDVSLIRYDPNNNVYFMGTFSDSVRVDGTNLTGTSDDLFAKKVADNGTVAWLKAAGTNISKSDVSINASGNIYVGGAYNTLTLNETYYDAFTSASPVCLKYTSDGLFNKLIELKNFSQGSFNNILFNGSSVYFLVNTGAFYNSSNHFAAGYYLLKE
jgi:hypothetical protein